MTDRIYSFFMQRVSEGRGLSAEATRAVAKGRVWSGEVPAHEAPRLPESVMGTKPSDLCISRTAVQSRVMFGRVAVPRACGFSYKQYGCAAGADALAHGLVDKLGGLQDAIALARQEAKLSEEVPFESMPI